MNTFLAKFKTINKEYFLVKDLNLNLIDYKSNAEVRDFLNLIFQHRLVPVAIKKNCKNLDCILKRNISNHFAIFAIFMKHKLDSCDKKVRIRARVINADSEILEEPAFSI